MENDYFVTGGVFCTILNMKLQNNQTSKRKCLQNFRFFKALKNAAVAINP